MTATAVDRRIRSLRPPKDHVDPYTAQGSLLEEERRPDGTVEHALTVFLTGAECPFTCTFCDLWRWTIEGRTRAGALPNQLQGVLRALDGPMPQRLKIYNASNFFDPRAVPSEDLPTIAALSEPFAAVTVESHASTIGNKTLAFARQIRGRLEVAMGLETIHPVAAAQLNKRLDLPRFDAAMRFLSENGIDIRVFVLLGAPYVPVAESVAWTVRSVEYAADRGASVISIVPVRAGNGELERLHELGVFKLPTLSQLEEALEQCPGFTGSVVTADLWDADRLTACANCRQQRVERLRRVNVTGRAEPRIDCAICEAT